MKKKKRLIKFCSSSENVRLILSAFIMICLVLIFIVTQKNFSDDFIEISTFSAVLLAFLTDSLIRKISTSCRRKLEDENKLNEDYNKLIDKYDRVETFMCIDNVEADESNRKIGRNLTSSQFKSKKEEDKDKYILPVCDKVLLKNKETKIIDSTKMYEPCSYIMEHMDLLSKIHEFSCKYNNTNIRVDRVEDKDGIFNIETSRTKYFYSLMTNRSMDYKINGISYRDMYEEGPFLRELEHSTLSNHLGFNGYVETEDGKFVFVLRHGHSSIGKNMIQNSIGASLKAKYALDNNKELTKDGIVNAIKFEIIDELKLCNLIEDKNKDDKEKKQEIANDVNLFNNFNFNDNVLYFYRDLVEGGKPQLMFYVKLNVHSDKLVEIFSKENNKKSGNQEIYTQVDGNKIILVDKEDLNKIYLAPDLMVINNKAYKAMPSYVATHVMLMEYLNMENEEKHQSDKINRSVSKI